MQDDRPASDKVPAANVFLDVSGSMAGYVARPQATNGKKPAGAGEPRVFRDIVLSLPELAAAVADTSRLYAFGRTIRPLSPADVPRAAQPGFFSDQDSRIQDALTRLDALPAAELGILITDLFLSGEEVFAGGAALRAPMARMLDGGRSIALVGIRSAFSGTVYDIPGVKAYKGATERPFYILASGPIAAVSRFLQRLRTEFLTPLPPTRDGQPRFHTVIFTKDPFRNGPEPLRLTPVAPAIEATSLGEFGDGVARVRFAGGEGSAKAEIPLSSLAWSDALIPDRFRVSQNVWAESPGQGEAASCPSGWLEIHSLAVPAQVTKVGAGELLLSIGGGALSNATPDLTFLLRSRIEAIGLDDDPTQTAWTRSWNLEARDAEDFVAGHPSMFRTLNLREVVTMLEGIVRDGLAPRTIAESLMAFQVSL